MSPLPPSVGSNIVYSCAQRLPSFPEKTLGDRGLPSSLLSSLPTQRSFLFCIIFLRVFLSGSFLNLLQSCLCFLGFFFFGCKACGALAPRPGFEPPAPALEGEILTTGPPGKSRYSVLIHLSWTSGILQVHEYPGFSGFSVRTALGVGTTVLFGDVPWMTLLCLPGTRGRGNGDTQRRLPSRSSAGKERRGTDRGWTGDRGLL